MKKKLWFMLCVVYALNICAQQSEKPIHYQIGSYNVYMLIESEGNGNTSILIDAPQAVIEKYIPDGTYPNAIHAVLIEKKGEVWLVDTGFGRNIFGQMATVGISADDVNHILLTHMHGDHIGGMLKDGHPAFAHADVTLSFKEQAYWGSKEEMMKVPDNKRGGFVAAQNVLSVYADRLKIQEPYVIGEAPAEGIHMLEAYGHTPGHVMFLLQDGKDKLLIWGDLTHAMAVQMPHPEISVTYDVDPDMARESRIKVLKYVSEHNLPIAGMHIASPGVGEIKADKHSGGYQFTAKPGK